MKVLVTTDKRGVFYGEIEDIEAIAEGDPITLKNARNIVYWSAATRGFLGIAATGPADGSRVGPAVPSLTLMGITSVAVCTEIAAAAIEAGPWK